MVTSKDMQDGLFITGLFNRFLLESEDFFSDKQHVSQHESYLCIYLFIYW